MCKSKFIGCKKLWDKDLLDHTKLTAGEIKIIYCKCRYLRLDIMQKILIVQYKLEKIEKGDPCSTPKMLALDKENARRTKKIIHRKNFHKNMSDMYQECNLK